MKTIIYSLFVIGIFTVTACSSSKSRSIASGNFDYIEAQPAKKIAIPAGLDEPEFTRDFELPQLGENAQTHTLGKELQVVSPSLVLPLVSGSYIEEGSKIAKIKFDKVDDSKPLDAAIWDTVIGFLDENSIEVDSFDPEKGQLLTDWIIVEQNQHHRWYKFFEDFNTVGRKFEFNLALAPHGRTAELSVVLRDYLRSVNDDIVASLEDTLPREEEVDILNDVISHYEYQIGRQVTQVRNQIRQGLDTELGFNADGDPAFIVDGIYDITWPRLQLVLRNLGFDVKDLDKSNGLVFVSYNGPGGSWWSNIFSSNETLLDVGDYRLRVNAQGEKTAVTFMTEESQVFEANEVTELYEPFATTMSKNNLDI